MANAGVKKCIGKLVLISAPIWLVVLFYVYQDPFKVLYHYDAYYQTGVSSPVSLNADYVNTETFLQNNPKYHYEAFIFGNSRSKFYQMDTWKRYIHTDRCFHYDASAESLLGIYRKIRFLDSLHVPIKHALMVVDYETLIQTAEYPKHLFMAHPLLSHRNPLAYQLEYLKTFFTPKFLWAYTDYTWSKKVKPYMNADDMLYEYPFNYSLKYNEMQLGTYEKMIRTQPKAFYTPRYFASFYSRPTTPQVSEQVMYDKQRAMLDTISRIFRKNNTQCKVIVNPLYNQVKLHPNDVALLQVYFGRQQVFDFSGINAYTQNLYNYYEASHYRPVVSNAILATIYKSK